MTDEQKEDLQFWLYTKVFADRQGPVDALSFAAAEVGVDSQVAFDYLAHDGRLRGTVHGFDLVTHDQDNADPQGIYVDIEWLLHILHRAGLKGPELWDALGMVYKIPASLARQEAEQIPIVEGED